MWLHHPRSLLLIALLLDWFGQLATLFAIILLSRWFAFPFDLQLELKLQESWLVFSLTFISAFRVVIW